MEVLIALLVVAVVAWFVTAPLRARAGEPVNPEEAEIADLEARKQAKYRQIRDAESDRAAGKLDEEDFRRLDAELRAEAIGILKRLDRARERRTDQG